MNRLHHILNDLNFDYFTDDNYIWVNNKQMYIENGRVHFSYPMSETTLRVDNPMLKSWIRNYITGGNYGN